MLYFIAFKVKGNKFTIHSYLKMNYTLSYRKEICDAEPSGDGNSTDWEYVGNFTMCPECEIYCPYWKLKKSCTLSKVAYLFDNYATIAFSIMMSIWGQ